MDTSVQPWFSSLCAQFRRWVSGLVGGHPFVYCALCGYCGPFDTWKWRHYFSWQFSSSEWNWYWLFHCDMRKSLCTQKVWSITNGVLMNCSENGSLFFSNIDSFWTGSTLISVSEKLISDNTIDNRSWTISLWTLAVQNLISYKFVVKYSAVLIMKE